MNELLQAVPHRGRLVWIGLRPGRREPLEAVECVRALTDRGLEGDRRSERAGGKRQVSLIQAEHLPVVAHILGRRQVAPELVRRNLVVSGINLMALKRLRFRIGSVLFEGTVACHPCSRMEEALGEGGYAAMVGHGGLLARVVEGGELTVGDDVHVVRQPSAE
jgi:MOSC domain-containing protein YiiM